MKYYMEILEKTLSLQFILQIFGLQKVILTNIRRNKIDYSHDFFIVSAKLFRIEIAGFQDVHSENKKNNQN